MTFLGEAALAALELIGGALALTVMFFIMLYAIVWGVALVCALLDCRRTKPPKQMWPRCPKCDSGKWLGKPGTKVCTNCGWSES